MLSPIAKNDDLPFFTMLDKSLPKSLKYLIDMLLWQVMKIFFCWGIDNDFMRVSDGVFVGDNTHLPTWFSWNSTKRTLVCWGRLNVVLTTSNVVFIWSLFSAVCDDHPPT